MQLTSQSGRISWEAKRVLCYVQFFHCLQPFTVLANLIIITFFPVRMGLLYDLLLCFESATFWFMYAFGYALQFPLSRLV